MDHTNLTAIELEVLEMVDQLQTGSWRPSSVDVAQQMEIEPSLAASTLRALRRAVLVNELPPRGAAPAVYGITVFGKRELRRRFELRAVA